MPNYALKLISSHPTLRKTRTYKATMEEYREKQFTVKQSNN